MLAGALVLVAAALPANARETFSIDYIVSIPHPGAAYAQVRWELVGVEEVKALVLRFPPNRITDLEASGSLETQDGQVRWSPNAPYGHLSYTVALNHSRGKQRRFDSFAGDSWIVTRASQIFPRTRIETYPRPGFEPKSRARLLFRLPSGWLSATAAPALGPNLFRISQPERILDRPRGWFVLGKFEPERQEIAGIMVQLARLPQTKLTAPDLFRFLENTLPGLQRLLVSSPENVLIVSAPDPMWHGGISAEQSFYMHGNRPLRTPDMTSPYLHEFFHVLQPFRPGPDADWIVEGLAEFYSLELQRRAGLIDEEKFYKGLSYFERYGLWNVDLRAQHDNAATNNSAPLVLYALDQRIQRATAGKKRLDDVVTELARTRGTVDTARFQHTVNRIATKKFSKFFERHVVRGEAPSLRDVR